MCFSRKWYTLMSYDIELKFAHFSFHSHLKFITLPVSRLQTANLQTKQFQTKLRTERISQHRSSKMVDAYVGKKYKLSTSDNFDEFMKALGVGLVTRKMGNAVSPVVDIQKAGDEYTLSSASTFKNVVTKFRSGVEFDQETPDGRKVKSTITVNGNVLTEVQKDPSGKDTTIVREFGDDQVKMVMTVDNITATRIYKLQA